MLWSQKHSLGVWAAVILGVIGFGIALHPVIRLFPDAASSDQLAAAASILGGIIGAIGTAVAVYLTLASQRRDEAEKIEGALRVEVSEFARLALGQYEAIELALKRGYQIPLRNLPTLAYMPDAVVFMATADRISRLEYGSLLVAMHARIAEALQMVRIYAEGGAPPSPVPSGLGLLGPAQVIAANLATLDKEKATTLANAWFDVCVFARIILRRDPSGLEIAEASVAAIRKDLDALYSRRASHAATEKR